MKIPGGHAVNTKLIDALPEGVTIVSATVNGNNVSTTNLATTSIPIRSPGAAQDGQVYRNEAATIVLTCSIADGRTGPISNQAFVVYDGVQSKNYPNDRVPSDDPNTEGVNDPTVVNGCNVISGTVHNDTNGATGGVDGAPMEGITVTLYAEDGTTVLATTTTDVNGNYSFLGQSPGNYIVQVSPPEGFKNSSSTCLDPKSGRTLVEVNGANVTGINFGAAEHPTAYAVAQSEEGAPAAVTLDALQGSDPNDQPQQGSWGSKSITITTLPDNGFVLTYDGVEVTEGQVIENYDPSKLVIAPGPTTPGGTRSTTFEYSVTNSAGIASEPAPYTVT